MIQLHCGDCLDVLREMPSGTVQCAVTSPPYFGIRDYGMGGQIGLEETPDAYVARLVEVFREVRRVLRDDATFWLNIGDSYAATTKGTGGTGKSGLMRDGRNEAVRTRTADVSIAHQSFAARRFGMGGAKPKDLLMIPARVALALQADGWYLRSEIVWVKPNPMPESVRDRPTSAHEKVFLLTKRATYFYDADAVREPAKTRAYADWEQRKAAGEPVRRGFNAAMRPGNVCGLAPNPMGRNCRNVWAITPKPYPGAHFAVMPQELVERCILAGSRPGDMVLDPFAGAGTVALVAASLSRHAIGIEINPAYLALARDRLGLFAPALAAE